MPTNYFKTRTKTAYSKGGGRPVYKYNPLDLEDDVAIGVMLPFNGGGVTVNSKDGTTLYGAVTGSSQVTNTKMQRIAGKFPLSYTTEQQAISNLKNLLLTYPGERYMQPTFGVHIKDYVFEQNTRDITVKLNQEIQDAIKNWLPYIIIKSLRIDNEDDRGVITNFLFINLTFKVTEQGANQTITLVSNGEQSTTVSVDDVNSY